MYFKGIVTGLLGAVTPAIVNQAIADRTPASVATRNAYIVAGSGLALGLAGQLWGRSGLTLRATNGLLYGSAAVGAAPLTALVDAKITKATTPATTTPANRVAIRQVAATPVRAVADLGDSFDSVGL